MTKSQNPAMDIQTTLAAIMANMQTMCAENKANMQMMRKENKVNIVTMRSLQCLEPHVEIVNL